jgi:hypothetical protein
MLPDTAIETQERGIAQEALARHADLRADHVAPARKHGVVHIAARPGKRRHQCLGDLGRLPERHQVVVVEIQRERGVVLVARARALQTRTPARQIGAFDVDRAFVAAVDAVAEGTRVGRHRRFQIGVLALLFDAEL